MISPIVNLWISFSAGLFAPIAAVCVLPLYPGFLAYLASQLSGKESKKTIIGLGFIVTAGIISSMFLFGLIFTFFLQESLTRAIGVVSPIAFGILAVVSILLIFDVDFGKIFPRFSAPIKKNPYYTSFIFGFFFGAIVLPCNPASLIILFAVSASTVSFITNLLNFVVFGLGMALPLLIFSFISAVKSNEVIGYLTRNKRKINFVVGIIMLSVSLYYLIFVFEIFSL